MLFVLTAKNKGFDFTKDYFKCEFYKAASADDGKLVDWKPISISKISYNYLSS